MAKKKKQEFMIAAVYDTETTNIGEGTDSRAFCILYIFNDIRMKDLKNYTIDKDDNVHFFRYENEALNFIAEMVDWGLRANVVPVICAYNLMFDMQTLMFDLNNEYEMEVNAQSSTNVYTLDLKREGILVLRFWDTYHLEMRGLAAMGETCGLAKAKGDWDYTLIRTCETPLTDEELFYAKRDVQVIPAYLKYLLNANEWLNQNDFGRKVLTKTSLVRQMAVNQIGTIRVDKRNGKNMTLLWMFEKTCKQQLPRTFEQYALRKSCFRGGFTFTSGCAASRVVRNVASLDVTSMHHAFINGRYVPMDFAMVRKKTLEHNMECVLSYSLEQVLEHYEKPFACAFHACFTFKNIRLKKGSCFDEWQIALIPSGKFRTNIVPGTDYALDERNIDAENYIREKGWHDFADNPVFAFGKLYSADLCSLFLSELELWCVAQVYEWDSIEVEFGESTVRFKLPPDYVTLQSNNLFEMKNDAKVIHKNYRTNVPYDKEIPTTIPIGIAQSLLTGMCDADFFASYYNSTVKGMFNGIYGTMAQDVYKPSYTVEMGELHVDASTKTTQDNFDEKSPKRCKVFYNYGLRIVGGSRMHLVIAMILLYKKLGNRIMVTGGDTDSLKIRCDEDITNEILLEALEPLHIAIENALNVTMKRVRRMYPTIASDLEGIGKFDCENANDDRWLLHMEAWNKARISISQDLKPHVTCAGLSRPLNSYHIEHYISDLLESGYSPEEILPNVLGYNVFVTHDICHALEHRKPSVCDVLDMNVTDYLGNTYHVCQTEAIALYDSGRMLGDTSKRTNADNLRYLRNVQNLDLDDSEKWVQLNNGVPEMSIGGEVVYHG